MPVSTRPLPQAVWQVPLLHTIPLPQPLPSVGDTEHVPLLQLAVWHIPALQLASLRHCTQELPEQKPPLQSTLKLHSTQFPDPSHTEPLLVQAVSCARLLVMQEPASQRVCLHSFCG